MPDFHVEMNFCRRCGSPLQHRQGPAYRCEKGHIIFLAASPAAGLILLNDKDEVLLLERAIDPGKGQLDIPGGFCDGPENPRDALVRELEEEVGLSASDYTSPEYVTDAVDPYKYRGETIPACSVVYTARVTSDKEPRAADDAASVRWVRLHDIDLDKIYFPAVRAGLAKVLERAGKPA